MVKRVISFNKDSRSSFQNYEYHVEHNCGSTPHTRISYIAGTLTLEKQSDIEF